MTDINQIIPDFTLPATGGKTFQLSRARGCLLILYFYPKDNTPGCTTEAQQFRDLHNEFSKLGCQIFGISRDNIQSHENFRSKLGLPFDLLSDHEETACRQFTVIKEKKLYGKTVRGIERSTFLIDSQGKLRQAWRGIKSNGHAINVLQYLQSILVIPSSNQTPSQDKR